MGASRLWFARMMVAAISLVLAGAASGCEPQTPDLTQLRQRYASEISSVSTFKTHGFDKGSADRYLAGPEGRELLQAVSEADHQAAPEVIYARTLDMVLSGSTAPRRVPAPPVLVKIVPKGQQVSPYSPYFTLPAQLAVLNEQQRCPADALALPVKSEAEEYDVYQITPLSAAASVFVSDVAPTVELDGKVSHAGGASQFLVPDRTQRSVPVLVGKIRP